jgi:GNAT superfamily N-acetyltransferase
MAIRRHLRPGDGPAIERLHANVYGPEYGLGTAFVAEVARNVSLAQASGWPDEHGAVWLVDGSEPGTLLGALALTREQPSTLGRVRWFALAPELRGQGLGRQMLDELLAEAKRQGMRRLELETFSALSAAAHLYREAGFTLEQSRPRDDWGPQIVYQRYALEL